MVRHGPSLNFDNLSYDNVTKILQNHQISLSVEEATILQREILKRPPTLAECFLFAIQGSEHCSYKSSKKYLKSLTTDGPNVILGAKEDAGIVCVATDHQGRRYGIAMSHESHNHPSQIVPYEGAATGVGGNMRDVSCMGAEVIATADSLRFGHLKATQTHRIYEGVIAGIGEYGNAVGIPNIAGDVYFNSAYQDNCLVTVVTLGLVAEDQVIHSYAPQNADNYVYILVGKPTDNSGFGGASFASFDLEDTNHQQNKGAVQEPNAFLKRHLLKANQALFKKLQQEKLLQQVGFKDLGAGGIACATVEMAEASGYGAEIDVECIPTSMKDLPSHVILCSETQERFMWVVPPQLAELFLDHYNIEFALPKVSSGACAAIIGRVKAHQKYIVRHHQNVIVDACAADVTKGIVFDRAVQKRKIAALQENKPVSADANQILLQLLAHENIASRQPILETYDKQVQGRTLTEAGEGDAGVLTPFNDDEFPVEIRATGIALSLDHNPRYNQISAYWGAVNAVVEAARNVVATGATPQAITDCLCFGNPENPECMGDFVDSLQGIKDACAAIGLPDFPGAPLPTIAGNVSFYNESKNKSIPPSPMISCLGVIPDAKQSVSCHFKHIGSHILMIGQRKNECGGSVYYELHDQLGALLPKPDLGLIAREFSTLITSIQSGYVQAAHDVSEGGVAVALAEMTFKNHIGIEVSIDTSLDDMTCLFSESGGFIFEVLPEHLKQVQAIAKHNHIPVFDIGRTSQDSRIKIQGQINLAITDAAQRWHNGLREKLL